MSGWPLAVVAVLVASLGAQTPAPSSSDSRLDETDSFWSGRAAVELVRLPGRRAARREARCPRPMTLLAAFAAPTTKSERIDAAPK